MYFCRLLSMLFLALFSSLSWSVTDIQSMPSGYGALPDSRALGDAVELRGTQLQIKSPNLQDINSAPPKHSYPLSLNVAGASVKARQEIFESGLQVLSFDLSRAQKIDDVSGLSLSEFQQLIFMLSRSAKTVVMRFYSLTRTAEIQINQLLIETELPEGGIVRTDLPELLSAQAASQLLQAVECGLNTEATTGHPVVCRGGILEKLDDNHVFFEASQSTSFSLPEWQVQANSSEFVELTNGTTQLILTLNDGVIVKGDVITYEDPSDILDEETDKEERKKSEENSSGDRKKDDSEKDSTPPSQNPEDSSGGDRGRDDDNDRDRRTTPQGDEEDDSDDEEEEEEDEEDPLHDGMVESERDDREDLMHEGVSRRKQGRGKYQSEKDRSLHQRRRFEQKTGLVVLPSKREIKSSTLKKAKTKRR